MKKLWAWLLAVGLTNCAGCADIVPQYRRSVVYTDTGRGYHLPWCEDETANTQIGGQRMPCRPWVAPGPSACERRFGSICNQQPVSNEVE